MSEIFLKQIPQDLAGKPCSSGSENKTFHITTTTGWVPVVLPDGVECKNALLQVRSSNDATALNEEAPCYLFSSESDGVGSFSCKGIIGLGVGKASGTLGYIYTGIADQKIAVITVA